VRPASAPSYPPTYRSASTSTLPYLLFARGESVCVIPRHTLNVDSQPRSHRSGRGSRRIFHSAVTAAAVIAQFAMSTPKVLSRKANGVAGPPAADAPKAPRTKPPPEGEKVVVRRLPPAMTQDEFIAILGDEWRVGHGKADWFLYCPGKVSQQSVFSFPGLP